MQVVLLREVVGEVVEHRGDAVQVALALGGVLLQQMAHGQVERLHAGHPAHRALERALVLLGGKRGVALDLVAQQFREPLRPRVEALRVQLLVGQVPEVERDHHHADEQVERYEPLDLHEVPPATTASVVSPPVAASSRHSSSAGTPSAHIRCTM